MMKRMFAALALAAFAASAIAQTGAAYPEKSIRLVVPFAAGGALDVVARIVGQKMTETWGKQIVIDNRLGAGGNIGAEFVAKAPADGYTLLMSSVTTQAINMNITSKPPYDFVRDYAPVGLVASAPLALVIHTSLPAKSVKAFIALAKAHPGELNYFSSGTGTGTHLAAVIFDQLAGVKTTHVPYKGGAQGLGDLLSGQVQFAMSTIGLVAPHVQTGRLRLLGVGSVKRYTRLPDIPTIAESVKGYEAEQWYGVVGPAGTPAAIVNKLAAEIKTIVANPDVRERFYSQGIEPVYATPEEFAGYIKLSVAKYAKVIKTLGLKVE
ncbi:MAG: tripartite tricarboxylate transporter substrate binding protein [Betaproteobacteria bacterium]